jgi:hypothetical protein
MKRILIFILIFAACTTPAYTQPSESHADWSIRTGVNLSPGLVYNRSWEPGYTGTALYLMLLRQSGGLILGAGVEAGLNYTGLNLLFPLRAGFAALERRSLGLSVNVVIMPGLILSRPDPFFLFAAELSAVAAWEISPRFSLAFTAGPRYTLSPGYTETVSPLELLDLTLGFAAGFGLGE